MTILLEMPKLRDLIKLELACNRPQNRHRAINRAIAHFKLYKTYFAMRRNK